MKQGNRLIEIKKASQVRVGEDAQRPSHSQAPSLGFSAASQIIDEEFVGVQQLRQGQSCTFTRIEEAGRRIEGRVGKHLEPRRKLGDPGPHRSRRRRVS